MPYSILNTIGDQYPPEAREILDILGAVDYLDITQGELADIIGRYDIAVISLGLRFDRQVLERADNLKAIGTATTGLDHIDIDYARERGIEVLSLRGERKFLDTITGTAELAWGLLLDLTRNILPAAAAVKQYHWRREEFIGHQLHGKILGIVGLGRLGSMTARFGQAFGMKVITYDPYLEDSQFAASGAAKVSFDELLAQSDVISIHVHLNEETSGMFNKAVFAKMKPTAYLINTARGKVVHEADLLAALQNKKIAGYAADVLADELKFAERFAGHPLVEYGKTHSNVIIVPHIGGATAESRAATDIFIAKKLKNYFNAQPLAVNSQNI